ncbi:hypothetical protein BKA56DRAFT_588995 [Ilyonectria sp. MPI-CAGE-AT-0026]|nr:hypothetical protein BKA56DRAFT_588995 [Ilyonectria sp. MPI-CAGE-AT-0026]
MTGRQREKQKLAVRSHDVETLDPSPMISQAHHHLPQLQRLPAYPLRRLLPSPCTNASTQHASIYCAPATPRSPSGPQATRTKYGLRPVHQHAQPGHVSRRPDSGLRPASLAAPPVVPRPVKGTPDRRRPWAGLTDTFCQTGCDRAEI